MTEPRPVWRVGRSGAPLEFVPWERVAWQHRFDDHGRRFRTVYAADLPETALREVLADVRPNASEVAEFLRVMGPEARDDLPSRSVTAAWRRQHELAPARMRWHGDIIDLTDHDVRHELEQRHAALLAKHGLVHLDLHEVTTRRRVVTQTIASDAYDHLHAAIIRFPSSLDANVCYALLEGRAVLEPAGDPVPLTDPAPPALQAVAAAWRLELEPAPTAVPARNVR